MHLVDFVRCKRALSGLLALSLVGCAATAPPGSGVPVVAVPSTWSAAGGLAALSGDSTLAATSLAQWWERFNDPQLSALVAQALQANTTVRSAQAALQQARAQTDVQSAGLLPSVGASASVQRARSGGASAGNSFQAGFDASWEPDIFGGQRNALRASVADSRAAEANLAQVQVSLAAEVAANYIALRGLQLRLDIARSNLASQQETLQISQWRLQAGLVTSLVTEQARAATAQTAAQIPALQASLAQSRHALAVLTGQPPAALDAALLDARPVPQPADDLALAFPADTLRQRPDVRVAQERVAAALARVAQADAARYPDFRLSGSLGLRALTVGALTSGGAVAQSLLASVSGSLFDGGAARAQVRVQEAGAEQARLDYEATVLTALTDVEDALVALRGERERLVQLRIAAEAARNAALLAQNRYTSGLIDFQAVLETQRTQLATQDSVASTLTNLSTHHVRLYKALGGGWSP
ncbi:MAG: efflux transporter outer membrane subunit [Simplicispira sp.]|nr:efflux transporter outer membrane subunit [Simplicispira sp.]